VSRPWLPARDLLFFTTLSPLASSLAHTVGNHDYDGSLRAQETYAADPRWSAFHNRSVIWALPPSSGNRSAAAGACLGLVFIDTTPLIRAYHAEPDPGTSMAANLAATDPAAQLAWLNASLAAAAAVCPAVAVVGHHPGLSCTGRGNNDDIMASVYPALSFHGVDAYITGHDHHLAHIVYSTPGVDRHSGDAAAISFDQITSGAGSEIDFSGTSTPQTAWFQSSPGFTLHSFNESHAQHTFVHGVSGQVLHSVTRVLNRKASSASSSRVLLGEGARLQPTARALRGAPT
jgi:hypothetical protein